MTFCCHRIFSCTGMVFCEAPKQTLPETPKSFRFPKHIEFTSIQVLLRSDCRPRHVYAEGGDRSFRPVIRPDSCTALAYWSCWPRRIRPDLPHFTTPAGPDAHSLKMHEDDCEQSLIIPPWYNGSGNLGTLLLYKSKCLFRQSSDVCSALCLMNAL